MSTPMFHADATWVWDPTPAPRTNVYVCFRRMVVINGPPTDARLRVTADARYDLTVNGHWLGHGPPRSWPSPWPVDEYDLRGVLQPGFNLIAALVHRIGYSTFQYLDADPGLLAQLDWNDGLGAHRVVTDRSWRCTRHNGYAAVTPRVSVQLGWEEQFDARTALGGQTDDWRKADYDDSQWSRAAPVRKAGEPPHEQFEPRDIPMLTAEPVAAVAVRAIEAVRPARYTRFLDLRPLINDVDTSANLIRGEGLLVTYLHSDRAQPIDLHMPMVGLWELGVKLSGKQLKFDDHSMLATETGVAHARLKKGWNELLIRTPTLSHSREFALNVWTRQPVRFAGAPREAAASRPWTYLGPVDRPPNLVFDQLIHENGHNIEPVNAPPGATPQWLDAIWERGTVNNDELTGPCARPVGDDLISPAAVGAACMSEQTVTGATVKVEQSDALLHDTADWTTIHPPPGADARILLDFGRGVIGCHEFEIDAPAGTLIDNHNFEFIQRDGRINLPEGMFNSFRYVCREGVQRYRTVLRRGLRYSWLTLRNCPDGRAVRIRFVRLLMSTYPQARQGDFACSDPQLERIWQVGAHSVRCCAEDTYTDCPTYEQTHWVGDARNEAMVDLVVNGDSRLSEHCWVQAGRSLDRAPIVEGLVPSGWPVVLPAWAFLWMRWALGHFMLTGDKAFGVRALAFLNRNVRGMVKHVNDQGLFEISAWNMFDWADMDCPHHGVVTHQNCLAVLGLREASQLAQLVGHRSRANEWRQLADRIGKAVSKHLWHDRKRAYVDCIHTDGRVSKVFSQQTQTAAYISGVAAGARKRRCLEIVERPPRGFVRAGSPFFMFFLLEALVAEDRRDEMIETIRDYWGRQIDAGATTFWEMYHPEAERITRSHCHGWSAAPTFFLSQHVLGVRPIEPGYGQVAIAPVLEQLTWAQGRVPTPRGPITVAWRREPKRFSLNLTLPPKTTARLELPAAGRVKYHTGKAAKTRSPRGVTHLTTSAPHLNVVISR